MMLLAILVLLPACPGEMGPIPDYGAGKADQFMGDSLTTVGDGFSATFEWGAADGYTAAESGASPDISSTPDMAAPPDTYVLPDSPPVQQDHGTTGGKCPCTAPLLCVNNACRSQCAAPTDGCNAISNCPSDHACAPTNLTGTWVCIPGVAPGKPCGGSVYCYQKYVCASVNSSPYTCLPVCSTAGSGCGSGGTCLPAGKCLFCSST